MNLKVTSCVRFSVADSKGWGECEISYKVKIKLNHMPSGKENLQLASLNNDFF